ncbi:MULTISPECIES: hypothetical protein [Parabacteroides]|uniref:hypothetical protein n=1 Tax=Parabacteroides leei TaxID=2939491 RepID=UPI00189741B0|nr:MULTISPECIES: hypothetical protein [Parabacteroides]MCL3849927.1 hypothetical protein [Parabacteroides leei]
MARQIKPTPVLKDEDAVNFIQKLEQRKKASKKELERMNEGFQRINEMMTFKF